MDDISNLITAETNAEAAIIAKDYALDFKKHTDRLKLTISKKSSVTPENDTTKAIASFAQNKRITWGARMQPPAVACKIVHGWGQDLYTV